jgi:hypothetical protein
VFLILTSSPISGACCPCLRTQRGGDETDRSAH